MREPKLRESQNYERKPSSQCLFLTILALHVAMQDITFEELKRKKEEDNFVQNAIVSFLVPNQCGIGQIIFVFPFAFFLYYRFTDRNMIIHKPQELCHLTHHTPTIMSLLYQFLRKHNSFYPILIAYISQCKKKKTNIFRIFEGSCVKVSSKKINKV